MPRIPRAGLVVTTRARVPLNVHLSDRMLKPIRRVRGGSFHTAVTAISCQSEHEGSSGCVGPPDLSMTR